MTPLRQRMINDMTVRGLARSTMASYLRSVTRLARHYRRSPDQISAREVQDFLVFLQQHERIAPGHLQHHPPRRTLLLPHHPRPARPPLLRPPAPRSPRRCPRSSTTTSWCACSPSPPTSATARC